jgi:hypothetical protein
MDPPQINYVGQNCLMVVNSSGKMRQLFTPFLVEVIAPTSQLHVSSWVMVEEVQEHREHRIVYRVGRHWWPYSVFKLRVDF